MSDIFLAFFIAPSSPGKPDATHSLMALSRARLSFLLIASSRFLSKASGDLVPNGNNNNNNNNGLKPWWYKGLLVRSSQYSYI